MRNDVHSQVDRTETSSSVLSLLEKWYHSSRPDVEEHHHEPSDTDEVASPDDYKSEEDEENNHFNINNEAHIQERAHQLPGAYRIHAGRPSEPALLDSDTTYASPGEPAVVEQEEPSIQATLVDTNVNTDAPVVKAEPLPVVDFSIRLSKRMCLLVLSVVAIATIVTVVVLAAMGKLGKRTTTEPMKALTSSTQVPVPTSPPSTETTIPTSPPTAKSRVTNEPTPIPTSPPTSLPVSTSAPTGIVTTPVLAMVAINLPDSTLAIIQGDTAVPRATPQGLAWDWLSLDPLIDTYSLERATNRFALATLYYTTDGPNWKVPNQQWLVDANECNWYNGIYVESSCANGTFQTISLWNIGLKGTLPPEIALLSTLEYLSLSWNKHLTGTIPVLLGSMSRLRNLGLYGSALTGTIPSELQRLRQLRSLDLSGNALTGTIPSEIGLLSQLDLLYLYNNALTGTIPSELGRLSQLTWLLLNNNALSGAIPSEIWSLSGLMDLSLDSNALTGSVPQLFCDLMENHGLRVSIDCDKVICDCGCTCSDS